MQFEISHELDAPLDAVELAFLSPDLAGMMVRLLQSSIASVETIEHVIAEGEMRRVLRFQAESPLALFRGYEIAREALSWEEVCVYRLSDHVSTWSVAPREQYRRYFRSKGTYRLERAPGGRTRRTVMGEIEIKASVLSPIVERMALAEVKKTYDAEAETLRRLSTL